MPNWTKQSALLDTAAHKLAAPRCFIRGWQSLVTQGLLLLGLLWFSLFGTGTEAYVAGVGNVFLGLALLWSAAWWCCGKQVWTPSRMQWLLFCFCVLMALRALNGGANEYGVQDFGLFTSFLAVSWLSSFNRYKLGNELLWLVFFALLMLANLGMCALQQLQPTYMPLRYVDSLNARSWGFFGHYNYFAHFCGIVAVTGYAFATNTTRTLRIFWLFLFILAVISLLAAKSRGALVSLLSALVIVQFINIYLLKIRASRWYRPVLYATLALLVVGWIGYEVIIANVYAARGIANLGDFFQSGGRTKLLQIALSIGMEAPWSGVGARGFAAAAYKYRLQDDPFPLHKFDFVHNEYAQLFCDYGIWGVILVLLGAAVLAWTVWRKLSLMSMFGDPNPKVQRNSAFLVAASGILGFSMAHAWVDFSWHIPALLCWVGVACGWILAPVEFFPYAIGGIARRAVMIASAAVLGLAVGSFGWKDAQRHYVSMQIKYAQDRGDKRSALKLAKQAWLDSGDEGSSFKYLYLLLERSDWSNRNYRRDVHDVAEHILQLRPHSYEARANMLIADLNFDDPQQALQRINALLADQSAASQYHRVDYQAYAVQAHHRAFVQAFGHHDHSAMLQNLKQMQGLLQQKGVADKLRQKSPKEYEQIEQLLKSNQQFLRP